MQLAECAPSDAMKYATECLARMLPDEATNAALVAALKVGANEAVVAWLEAQEPDLRSRTISKLGSYCEDTPEVGQFFVSSHDALGDRFWQERWHRGLAECRADGISELLTAALDNDTVGRNSRNSAQFFTLLGVDSRNVGAAAIPTLSASLEDPRGEEAAVLLVSVFADAAGVGSPRGLNSDAATAASENIIRLAPALPSQAVERARGTLVALGNEAAASNLARHRWTDRWTEPGYQYAATASEIVTCKNDKQQAYFHRATFQEPGAHWPDQMAEGLEASLSERWNLEEAATKCKGTAQITVAMANEPFASNDEALEWLQEAKEAFETTYSALKPKIVDEDPFTW